MTKDWVTENFDSDSIELWNEWSRQKRICLKVPDGASSSHQEIPAGLQRSNAPPIRFKQKSRATCASDSMASVLAFLGLEKESLLLHEFGVKATKETPNAIESTLFGKVRDFVRMNCGKNFIPHRIDRHKFNLLDNQNISESPFGYSSRQ